MDFWYEYVQMILLNIIVQIQHLDDFFQYNTADHLNYFYYYTCTYILKAFKWETYTKWSQITKPINHYIQYLF